jgi:hypothetical protein
LHHREELARILRVSNTRSTFFLEFDRYRRAAARTAAALPLAFLAICASVAVPLHADWLLFNDGSRLETRGPWEVRGELLVFTSTDGTFSSVRLGDVDVEGSRRLTEEAERAKTAPKPEPAEVPTPPREAVFVLTDADVRHGASAAPEAEGEPDSARPDPRQLMVVSDWARGELYDDGAAVLGTLANQSEDAAGGIELTVRAVDSQGILLVEQPVALRKTVLMPGEEISFEVHLDGVFDFESVDFDVVSVPLALRGQQATPEEAGAPEETIAPEEPLVPEETAAPEEPAVPEEEL